MAGNWKMNCDHLEAAQLVQKTVWGLSDAGHDFDTVEVAVAPPFTALRTVQTLIEGERWKIRLAAQDVSGHPHGAYTGDVSAAMLARLKVAYTVVGHSERRQHHGETDAVVATKATAALDAGLTPIVCVGEHAETRNAGNYVEVVTGQVRESLAGLSGDAVASLVVAYEPVWAIGTGAVATPDDAQEVCAAVRAEIAAMHDQSTADAVRVLYGGSVKPGNIAGLMAQDDIDGALVGGASLTADDFVAICRFSDH